MNHNEIVSGRARAWSLLEKLGEGDAGEVFRVESIMEGQPAILKRPHRTAFASEKLRQASQIEREGQSLRALSNLDITTSGIRVPQLLDQSKVGVEQSDRFFIIITPASGFDLSLLARSRRFGNPVLQPGMAVDPQLQAFIQRFSQVDRFPDLLLLRVIKNLVLFLEQIHAFEFSALEGRQYGVIWNDVKPEHCYWDPLQSAITLIDWGNAAFLDSKGISADRAHSRLDDIQQLLEEFGAFLKSEAPDLYKRLEWPQEFHPADANSDGIQPLKARLDQSLASEMSELKVARQEEEHLLRLESPQYADFETLDQLHTSLVAFGELPDYKKAADFIQRLAARLISNGEINSFQTLCHQSELVPTLDHDAWKVLYQISELAASENSLLPALKLGLAGDWPGALWQLRLAALTEPEPAWWGPVKDEIRQLHLGTSSGALTPYVALNRVVHTLHATAHQTPSSNNGDESCPSPDQCEELGREIKSVLLKRWIEVEPDPPGADLSYLELEPFLKRIHQLLPEAGAFLDRVMTQPRAQVHIILDAWENQDYALAQRALRTLLVWDPDRRRFLSADKAIQSAPEWLRQVSLGPRAEPRPDFVTRMELQGRNLLGQIGPASWLESILETFKSLRKGAEPADVMLKHPELREVTGWLLELEPSRPLLISPDKPVILERLPREPSRLKFLDGRLEARLGEGEDMLLGEPLDTWAPEARGSSARVFEAFLRDEAGVLQEVAVKLMRPGRGDYALPLFDEETRILQHLSDLPGVTPLLECGFIRLEPGLELPAEERHTPAYTLSGDLRRYGAEATRHFLVELPQRVANGWLPYLALETRPSGSNLLLRCDASYTRGNLLPILDGLRFAIQILDILAEAHARRVIYRDHKILHYYWEEVYNGIGVIDWNIAKLHKNEIPSAEVQFDLVQFSARALHHILTGRPAPGALPLGPNRPEDIETAARSYAVQWTYDDQRLPQSLRDIIERALSGGYQAAIPMREDLYEIFQKLAVLLRA